MWWLRCDDQTNNGRIMKLARKKSNTRHGWVDKVIHGEFCKKLNFEHTTEWYMYSLKSIQENKMNKILWDFEIQTDHLISARWPDLKIVNKKKKKDSAELWTLQSRWTTLKESEMKDNYQDLDRELKICGTCKWRLYQL